MLFFSKKLNFLCFRPYCQKLLLGVRERNVPCALLPGTSDIWLRDFMPVRTKSGKWISFRYEPSYLDKTPELRTDFKKQVAPQLNLDVTYSDINLDGGNIVFSPSRQRVLISDRIFGENQDREPTVLIRELEKLLEAQVIIIPSLKTDFTGHADGMVRFVDEYSAIGNHTGTKNGLEQRIKKVLKCHGINVIDFPYYASKSISAEGCYLNFLETENCIFLPVFGRKDEDVKAIAAARQIFTKEIIPVEISAIAREGGGLNCISWECDNSECRQ